MNNFISSRWMRWAKLTGVFVVLFLACGVGMAQNGEVPEGMTGKLRAGIAPEMVQWLDYLDQLLAQGNYSEVQAGVAQLSPYAEQVGSAGLGVSLALAEARSHAHQGGDAESLANSLRDLAVSAKQLGDADLELEVALQVLDVTKKAEEAGILSAGSYYQGVAGLIQSLPENQAADADGTLFSILADFVLHLIDERQDEEAYSISATSWAHWNEENRESQFDVMRDTLLAMAASIFMENGQMTQTSLDEMDEGLHDSLNQGLFLADTMNQFAQSGGIRGEGAANFLAMRAGDDWEITIEGVLAGSGLAEEFFRERGDTEVADHFARYHVWAERAYGEESWGDLGKKLLILALFFSVPVFLLWIFSLIQGARHRKEAKRVVDFLNGAIEVDLPQGRFAGGSLEGVA